MVGRAVDDCVYMVNAQLSNNVSLLRKSFGCMNQSSHFRCLLQFHQTIKTYIKDKVWDFYFYVSLQWPDVLICLHFPGCTLTVSSRRW